MTEYELQIEKRLTHLETNEATVFHKFDALDFRLQKQDEKIDILTKIANGMEGLNKKFDDMNERIKTIEDKPGKKWDKLKETVLSCLVTGVIGVLLGAILALIIK